MKTNRIITLILGMIESAGGKMFLIGDDKSISDIHLINSTEGRMR